MSEFAVQMRQISKSYDGFQANQKIDFNLKKGTIHAVAGENGAGKSTLMKVLFGLEQSDKNPESKILVHGKNVSIKSPLEAIEFGIGMVQQHFALAGALTPLENIILGAEPLSNGIFLDRKTALKKIEALAQDRLSVPWFESTESLSVGLEQRIEILKLLFRNADILILDEPTGVLAPQEIESFFTLLRSLRDSGKSIIIITHKLQEIFSLCDEVTVLRQGKLIGTYSTTGLTKEKLVEAMIGRPLKSIAKKLDSIQNGKSVIKVSNLSVEKKQRGSIKRLNFEIKAGEIVGVAGVEGNGQQALVEALMGLENIEGEIHYQGKLVPAKTNVRMKFGFGLISEDRQRQSLWMDETIKTNCMIGMGKKLSQMGVLKNRKITEHSKTILASYDVKMRDVNQKVKSLSGGNQQKIVVAREIKGRDPKFLIVSQPTRGVDVGAIELIHDAILQKAQEGTAILLISSELEEVCKLSDRILVLNEGNIAAEFIGPVFDFQKIGSAMIEKS